VERTTQLLCFPFHQQVTGPSGAFNAINPLTPKGGKKTNASMKQYRPVVQKSEEVWNGGAISYPLA